MSEVSNVDNLTSPEERLDPRSVAVVTTTFYKKWQPGELEWKPGQDVTPQVVDKVRGDIALKMVWEAKKQGFQLVVVDGTGEGSAFNNTLKELGVIPSEEKARGMSPSRQQGFKEASELDGVEVIAWVEPEKLSVTKDCLPQAIMPILRGEADVVVLKRSEEGFKTYPDYQVGFEQRADKIWNDILRKHGLRKENDEDLDVWFGPKFFRNDPELLKLFTDQYDFIKDPDLEFHQKNQIIRPDLWPNAIFLPIAAALAHNPPFRVKSVDVPYVHPAQQTAIEADNEGFRRKRDIQYKGIILTTEQFVRLQKGEPSRLVQITQELVE